MANCSKCSGFVSTFAPASQRINPFFREGMYGANAGLLIEFIFPTRKRDVDSRAPVIPELTTALTVSSFNN